VRWLAAVQFSGKIDGAEFVDIITLNGGAGILSVLNSNFARRVAFVPIFCCDHIRFCHLFAKHRIDREPEHQC
jgi:hypothetical protein